MGVCVCGYAPVNEKGMKGKMKLDRFWEDLGQLLVVHLTSIPKLGKTNGGGRCKHRQCLFLSF